MSSVSDREPGPAALGYTASKYGVRAFSESLRLAYGTRGLLFANIAPGGVLTAIDEQMGISFEPYQEMLGNPDFMSAEQLAEVILRRTAAGGDHRARPRGRADEDEV